MKTPATPAKAPKDDDRKKREIAIIKLFQDLTQAYGAKVNEVLKNMDNGLAHQPVYCECIAEVIKCYDKISTRLKIPKDYLIGFERHAENARKNILERTWKRTVSGMFCIALIRL